MLLRHVRRFVPTDGGPELRDGTLGNNGSAAEALRYPSGVFVGLRVLEGGARVLEKLVRPFRFSLLMLEVRERRPSPRRHWLGPFASLRPGEPVGGERLGSHAKLYAIYGVVVKAPPLLA